MIEHERKIAEAKAREDGKPEAIIPKIVEGYLSKFKDEVVLMRQVYIRDNSMTIQKLFDNVIVSTKEKIVIRRFARWALGKSSSEE